LLHHCIPALLEQSAALYRYGYGYGYGNGWTGQIPVVRTVGKPRGYGE
jgi:hypothetical protein